MVHYVEDCHLVNLESVLQEHASRLVPPAAVLDPSTGFEMPASIHARHNKCYNIYDHRDMALMRLYICSLLLSDMFYEAVQAKHLTMGHDFKRVHRT
jgi:hypothetical protein